eukprot:gene18222-37045_t
MKRLFRSRGWQPLVLALGWLLSPAAQTAPFEDSMAQRMLACTACHGPQGRAAADGYYPRIAGKPAGYLYNQLLNFRHGQRNYRLMTQMVDPLSDAYLLEIAQYFAALDLPYPAPTPVVATPAQRQRGEQQAGEEVVAQRTGGVDEVFHESLRLGARIAARPSTKSARRSANLTAPFARRQQTSSLSSSFFNPDPLYVRGRVRPTMEINAHVISGLDPGAIPGGSTNLSPGYRRDSAGPISIDRRLKVLLSLGVTHRPGSLN